VIAIVPPRIALVSYEQLFPDSKARNHLLARAVFSEDDTFAHTAFIQRDERGYLIVTVPVTYVERDLKHVHQIVAAKFERIFRWLERSQ
jgi:hypothetical protein